MVRPPRSGRDVLGRVGSAADSLRTGNKSRRFVGIGSVEARPGVPTRCNLATAQSLFRRTLQNRQHHIAVVKGVRYGTVDLGIAAGDACRHRASRYGRRGRVDPLAPLVLPLIMVLWAGTSFAGISASPPQIVAVVGSSGRKETNTREIRDSSSSSCPLGFCDASGACALPRRVPAPPLRKRTI